MNLQAVSTALCLVVQGSGGGGGGSGGPRATRIVSEFGANANRGKEEENVITSRAGAKTDSDARADGLVPWEPRRQQILQEFTATGKIEVTAVRWKGCGLGASLTPLTPLLYTPYLRALPHLSWCPLYTFDSSFLDVFLSFCFFVPLVFALFLLIAFPLSQNFLEEDGEGGKLRAVAP